MEKLIEETKRIMRLKIFLEQEVGLKEKLTGKELRAMLEALKPAK